MELIYIEWHDAFDYNQGWMNVDDVDEWLDDDWVVSQCGWVYEETDDYLVLINMCAFGHDSFSHVTKIPRPWIRKRETITLKCQKSAKKKAVTGPYLATDSAKPTDI